MPIPILMPALSPTMTEGNLVKWSKNLGDSIKPGDIIAEVETDKATMEIESIDEGKLEKILYEDGSEGISVNSLIAVLSVPEDKDSDIQALITKHTLEEEKVGQIEKALDKTDDNLENTNMINENTDEQIEKPVHLPVNGKKDVVDTINTDLGNKNVDITMINEDTRIFASPLARRMALISEIELKNVEGSGPKGKIVKADIDKINNLNRNSNKEEYIKKADKKITISSMRKTIAKRLSFSKSTVPHFYLTIDCIMKNLLNVRNEINLDCNSSENVSINDILIKALGNALKEVPEANCSWQEDHIVMYGNIDISVAVAVEGGLYTPVIRNADSLGIREISNLMKDFVKRAKANTLSSDEYEGGNFTLSNLGMHGVDNFSAIINPPQAGILAIGAIRKIPLMVDEDKIINSDVMSCQLSGDHRVLDGTIGAKLLHFFKLYIAHPSKMLL